jgi:hypothetical protein
VGERRNRVNRALQRSYEKTVRIEGDSRRDLLKAFRLKIRDQRVAAMRAAGHVCTPGPTGRPSFSMACGACMDAADMDAVDMDAVDQVDPSDGLTDSERTASAERYRSHWPDWAKD